jgi:GAF domain-containing protein
MPDELGSVFARMSGLLLSSDAVNTALTRITALAAAAIPGTSGCGITLVDPDGERTTAAATDVVVQEADALQYRLRQGPCLTAVESRTVIRVDDVAQDDRWPAWAGHATEMGLCSSLSAPLLAGTEPLGAMKVYAWQSRTYGDREEDLLTGFASLAAMLLSQIRTARRAERVSEQLKDSLRAREVIMLAKGIIMGRDGVDERTAFLRLADAAQQQHATLHQEADRLANSPVRHRL